MKNMLGYIVKDKVTKAVGVAVARIEWINGCVRYGIQQEIGADGKIPETFYVDQEQLEIVDKTDFVKKDENKEKSIKNPEDHGGDRKDPPSRNSSMR